MTASHETLPTTASERFQALARISALLRSGLPAPETMQAVLAAVPAIIPADAYVVWRFDERQHEWRVVGSSGLRGDYSDYAITERGDGRILLDGPFHIADVFASAPVRQRREFYEAEGIRSLFVLPLHISGENAGTLACYFREPRTVSAEEMDAARVLADIFSTLLSARKFDRFAEAARAASAELDLGRIVQTVTDAATEMTNAHFGAFFYNVLDDQGGSYMLYTISGVPREMFERFPMPRNTQVFAPTFAGSGTVRSANIRKDARYGKNSPYYGMPEGHLPVTSYLAVPVISRSGEVLGGLFFGHPEEGVFTDNEEQIVEALAAQAAVAIDNARLYDALQREGERLVRSESRYRAVVNATPARQFIWTATPDGRFVDDNRAWTELTGQTFDEMREWGWADAVHPDDAERVAGAWRDSLASAQPMEQEFRVRARDGAYRWIGVIAAPVFGEDGAVLEWVGTVIDIHDRRSAEDTLRFLATASDLLASSLDYETTLGTVARLAVPEVADWCAVDIADAAGGSYRRLAVAHVDPAKVELAHDLRRRFPSDPETDTVARVIRTGQPEWAAEIPESAFDLVGPEQRQIALELGLMSYIVVPLRGHEGILGALTFVLADSRRRYSQNDLAFAEELGRRAAVAIENARLYGEAQDANRAKDEFLATLSHELRTPMTAVLGWSRMLKMGLNAEETLEAIEAIERGASVQMQLIEDILDMSRIMAGKMRLDLVPVDLCAIAHSALSTVHPAAASKDIEILTSFPRETPHVLGDEGRLQQVVWNLLTNAIKFTERGGRITMRIGIGRDDVRLSIHDTGVGIDPAFLPHVFERFRQQDSSTTRAHGGIGLGLAIVRHLVDLHGGRITAESEGAGRGATFTVQLPAMRARRSEPSAPAADGELSSLAGRSVLVIDDEAMTRNVVSAMLRRTGAKVASAVSSAAARDVLDDVQPDIIVCDIAMPVEDGYAFLRALRALGSNVPVVALTAFGRPEDREKALRSGFSAFLKKPVDPYQLAKTLADLLR
jgi:PAS domain S-box-containing protein